MDQGTPTPGLPWVPGSRRSVVEYPGTTPMVSVLARQAASAELRRWGAPPEAVYTAQQIIAELVANAVIHGGDGPLTLDLAEDGPRVRITVTDRGRPPGHIRAGQPGAGSESGRGLAIVAELAEDWDHHYYPSNATAVWAVIALRPATTTGDLP